MIAADPRYNLIGSLYFTQCWDGTRQAIPKLAVPCTQARLLPLYSWAVHADLALY